MNRYIDEILELESMMQENFGDSQALAFVIGRAHHLQGDFTLAAHYYQMVQEGNQFYDEAQSRLAEILGEDETPDD
jgi:ATP/maltotriose-dependent transcriptional regulator MalT